MTTPEFNEIKHVQGEAAHGDDYFNSRLIPDDPMLNAVLRACEAVGLPRISVATNQGRLLMLLAKSMVARRILEMRTVGGYLAIWLARALPDNGQLISLENEQERTPNTSPARWGSPGPAH